MSFAFVSPGSWVFSHFNLFAFGFLYDNIQRVICYLGAGFSGVGAAEGGFDSPVEIVNYKVRKAKEKSRKELCNLNYMLES